MTAGPTDNTRWSTHGAPSNANAHPHTDCKGRLAVVHNGIIENHDALRERLEAAGHTFESETDTEVVPHLVATYIEEDAAFEAAFRRAVADLSGSYAITMLHEDTDTVYATRQGSPLVLGVADGVQRRRPGVSGRGGRPAPGGRVRPRRRPRRRPRGAPVVTVTPPATRRSARPPTRRWWSPTPTRSWWACSRTSACNCSPVAPPPSSTVRSTNRVTSRKASPSSDPGALPAICPVLTRPPRCQPRPAPAGRVGPPVPSLVRSQPRFRFCFRPCSRFSRPAPADCSRSGGPAPTGESRGHRGRPRRGR